LDPPEIGTEMSDKINIESNITEPRAITSKLRQSVSKFLPSVFPYGYYKKFLRIGHIFKQKRPRGRGVEYVPGLYSEAKMNPKETIKESIGTFLKRKAIRHVNEYMRSSDGVELRTKVNDIIKGKISEKKKVQIKYSSPE